VIARYLLNQGVSVRVYLLTDPKGLRGDAETNFNIFQRMKGEVISVPSSKDYVKVKKDLEKFDILVDGIFGTGLDAEVRGYYREVIDHLNTLQRPIVAIDIPSGLDADTGKPLGTAIRASLTVTFGLPKVGHLIPPGIDYVGEVKVIDIGIPKRLVEDEKIPTHLLEEKEIKRWLSIPGTRIPTREIMDTCWSSPDRWARQGPQRWHARLRSGWSRLGHPGYPKKPEWHHGNEIDRGDDRTSSRNPQTNA